MNHYASNVLERNLFEYERDGVTVCREVLSPVEVAKVKDEVERVETSPSDWSVTHRDIGDKGRFFIDILLHRRSSILLKLALDSDIPKLARTFLPSGPAFFFYDQLFLKEPFTKTRTQWHQDLPYWPLSGAEVPSLWLALTKCDAETSSVMYVPGSHRGPQYASSNYEDRWADQLNGVDICPEIHHEVSLRSSLLHHSLNPGDVVVHHPLVIHGAGPNQGATRRLALSFRYCSGAVRWQPRARTMNFPGTEGLASGTRFADQDVFPALHN